MHRFRRGDTWEAQLRAQIQCYLKYLTQKYYNKTWMMIFHVGLIWESSDMSAFHGGRMNTAQMLEDRSASTLAPAHCFAFSPGILASVKRKSVCFFSAWQLECQHHPKQDFVWETDCSSCNLSVYHLSGTHIWSSSCSELTENQSRWCTWSVEKVTENNIICVFIIAGDEGAAPEGWRWFEENIMSDRFSPVNIGSSY